MTERKTKRKKKTKKQIREATRQGVAALRERQRKEIHALGYTSEQNMTTRVLNNDLTPQHIEYLKGIIK
jgi:hypothetical protein